MSLDNYASYILKIKTINFSHTDFSIVHLNMNVEGYRLIVVGDSCFEYVLFNLDGQIESYSDAGCLSVANAIYHGLKYFYEESSWQ